MTRFLVIDNVDSFTHNIVQYLHEVTGVAPVVVRNSVRYEDLDLTAVDGIVISPGPGRPSEPADFGVCREVIERHELPILGVCLGHQGIAEVFGGRTVRAPHPVHGLVEQVEHDGTDLFAGLASPLGVVRYHSLLATDLPPELEVTARSAEGLVMALRHRDLPIWGVQFHPESIDTTDGHALLANLVGLVERHGRATGVAGAFTRVGGVLEAELRVREIDWPEDLAEHARSALVAGSRFWLDAEGSDLAEGRYSVLGLGAGDVTLSYDVTARRLTLAGPAGEESVDGDLLLLIDRLLSAADIRTAEPPTPFTAGLVGYLGYELKALCGAAPGHVSTVPDAGLVWPTRFEVHDHETSRAWLHELVPPGTGGGAGVPEDDGPRPDVRAAASGRSTTAHPAVEAGRPSAEGRPDLRLRDDRATYLAKIHRAQELIRDGQSSEICLCNVATAPAPVDPFSTYLRMRTLASVPYGAFLEVPGATLLSSSPETFLHIDARGSVTTRPIKGTRPRGRDPEEDARLRAELSGSRKDRAENLMVLDLVRHDLNGVCVPGSVEVPSAFEVRAFRTVLQLVSTVVGVRAPGRTSLDVVRSCFPPGSMTGAPKVRTMALIDDLEGSARGPYAGSLGWFDVTGAVSSSVVIRTVVVDAEGASFGIGGAITTLSAPVEEFEETLDKAAVPAFGLGLGRAIAEHRDPAHRQDRGRARSDA